MKKLLCIMVAAVVVMAMASVVFAGSIKGSLPNSEVGGYYSGSLEYEGVFGGNYYWSISDGNLPDGLYLAGYQEYLDIWGTATKAGTFNFTVMIVVTEVGGSYDDVLDSVTRDFTIVVTGDAPSTPRISGTLPDGSRNVPYSSTLRASNGGAPYTWSCSGTLPDGLKFRGNQTDTTGNEYILSGTPHTDGVYNFTVTVTDTYGGEDEKTFTVTIGSSSNNNTPATQTPTTDTPTTQTPTSNTPTTNTPTTQTPTSNTNNDSASGGGGSGGGCNAAGSTSVLILALAGAFFVLERKEKM